METALYFPLIRAPQAPWFTKILLYWDNAATIVPGSLRNREAVLGAHMSDLVQQRLVRMVEPERIVRELGDEFQSGFLAALDSSPIPPRSDPRRWHRVHAGKALHTLFWELSQRGIARQGGDWEWWQVEESTAHLYMTFLAGAICGANNGYMPVTDDIQSIADLGPPDSDMEMRLRKLRYAVVTQALPVPSGYVPAREIADFKASHGDKLIRLRRFLDGKIADLAVIDDEHVMRAKCDTLSQEIQDQIAVLRELMSQKSWPKVAFASVGGVLGSGLAAVVPFAAGGNALAIGLSVAAGTAGLGKAGYEAMDVLRAPRYDFRQPLVYAALAQGLPSHRRRFPWHRQARS
ncbi:DUF6236 family protein [Streptomyces sp. AC495_CC817]|uniref:DUF6236 family protein n=1 Tax=Streptomyces sp. AC495_CC817 TaxID=2823900 RepID=UPI001C26A5BE|nr:DUF6236 family protein [Streptomyces sp. AC495_CC817]